MNVTLPFLVTPAFKLFTTVESIGILVVSSFMVVSAYKNSSNLNVSKSLSLTSINCSHKTSSSTVVSGTETITGLALCLTNELDIALTLSGSEVFPATSTARTCERYLFKWVRANVSTMTVSSLFVWFLKFLNRVYVVPAVLSAPWYHAYSKRSMPDAFSLVWAGSE